MPLSLYHTPSDEGAKNAIEAVVEDPSLISTVPLPLKRRRDFALGLVSKIERHDLEWEHVEGAEGEREVVLAALATKGTLLECAPPSYSSDEEAVFVAVREAGEALRFVDRPLRARKDVSLAAVRQNGLALRDYPFFEHPEDHEEVVLAAVASNYHAAKYVPTCIRHVDKRLAIKMLRLDGRAYRYLCLTFKADEEVLFAATKRGTEGWERTVLAHAPPSLLERKEVFLRAVGKDGLALRYAPPSLLEDMEVALAAVRQNGHALFYSKEWIYDEEVVLAAVTENGSALAHCWPKGRLPSSVCCSKRVAIAAVKGSATALSYICARLFTDRDVVLAAVEKDGLILEETPFRGDREVAMRAVSSRGAALQFVLPPLHDDEGIVSEAVKRWPPSLKWASPRLRSSKEIALLAVSRDPSSLRFVGEVRMDFDVRLAAALGLTTKREREQTLLRMVREADGCDSWQQKEQHIASLTSALPRLPDRVQQAVETAVSAAYHPHAAGGKRSRDDFEEDFPFFA